MKIAWISPLPPTKSGIADYSVEIIESLADAAHYAIDCFIADDHAYPSLAFADKALPANVGVYSQHEFYTRASELYYDKYIFQWGSSVYHIYQWELLYQLVALYPRRDSVLHVIHDWPLHHIYVNTLTSSNNLGLLLAAYNNSSQREYPRFIQSYATRIINPSGHATLNELSQWFGIEEILGSGILVFHRNDTTKLPKAYMSNVKTEVVRQSRRIIKFDEDVRASLGIPDGTKIIATFGHVSRIKQVETFIRIAQQILERGQHDGQIWIVGPLSDGDYSQSILQLASQDHRVRVFNLVDDVEWHRRMQASDLIIQLRTDALAAVSSPMVQGIRHGKPVLVSAALVDAEDSTLDKPLFASRLQTPEDFISVGVEVLNGSYDVAHQQHLESIYSFGEMVKRYRELIDND